jgi:hypothetical protein
MKKFDKCPDELFLIMNDCWKQDPVKRPTFAEALEMLTPLVQEAEKIEEKDRSTNDYYKVTEEEAYETSIPEYQHDKN